MITPGAYILDDERYNEVIERMKEINDESLRLFKESLFARDDLDEAEKQRISREMDRADDVYLESLEEERRQKVEHLIPTQLEFEFYSKHSPGFREED
jgi:hypothetical protein